MKFLILIITVACFISAAFAKSIGNKDDESPSAGIPYNEELVVVSSLNVKPKEGKGYIRQKRQFGNFGQSSAAANANAFNNYYGPQGFGASSALAGAQSFNSQGPAGGFGASAANSGSQGFHAGPGGFGANAAFGASQNYNLPGGHHVGISVGESYTNNNGQGSAAHSGGITYT